MPAFLIDSNLLTYWVASKGVLRKVQENLKLPNVMLGAYQKRYKTSISFLERVSHGKSNSKSKFYIYNFTIFETINALKDEIKTMYLFKNGAPLSTWADKRQQANMIISEDLIGSIYNSFYEALDKLFENKSLSILDFPFTRNDEGFDHHLQVYEYLTLRLPNLRTQDAMILSAGLVDDIEYLVTKDTGLKKMNNELKKVLNGTGLSIKIIDPGDALLSR